MTYAREVWTRLEVVHAVTYFSPAARAAATEAGLKGFWMGYFGFRAAPLGAVPAAVVEATFYNFAPRRGRRAVPDAWGFAPPERILEARSASAAAALREVSPGADAVAAATTGALAEAVEAGIPDGRPLFAANRALPRPDDPVELLWLLCTALREHRGDGHVAALTAAGVAGLEAHVLVAAERGTPPELFLESRGWTPEEWAAAAGRLRSRGLLDAGDRLTAAGAELRAVVEARTDDLAATAFAALGEDRRARLLEDLTPLAAAVESSGWVPYPNPIGLGRRS